MRRHLFRKFFSIFFFLGLCSSVQGVVNWLGLVPGTLVGGPYLSSADSQINISGNCFLAGAAPGDKVVHVVADGPDMTINVTVPSVITANDGPNGAQQEIALHLHALTGRTIHFNIHNNLDFLSSDHSFVVAFTGPGNLMFHLADGKTLKFDGQIGPNTGVPTGTFFLLNMDMTPNAPWPDDIVFDRQNGASNNSVNVVTGANSLISYVSDPGTWGQNGYGTIACNASNSTANNGRMMVRLQDTSSVSIEGHELNPPSPPGGVPPILNNLWWTRTHVVFTSQVGQMAEFKLLNSNPGSMWSGLLVENNSATMPDLRSNPWAQSPNSVGIQYGWVLGRNGKFTAADGTYLQYMANTSNVTPSPNIPQSVLDAIDVNGISPTVNEVVKDRCPAAFWVDGNWTGSPWDTPRAQVELQGDSKLCFGTSVYDDGPSRDPNYLIPDPNEQLVGKYGNGTVLLDIEGPLNINGTFAGDNAIEILSLEIDPHGSSVHIEGSEIIFPERTFATTSGVFNQYGKGCFLVNNRMNLRECAIQHSDILHRIYDKNIGAQSEAAYTGGETFKLVEGSRPRPTVAFYNSELRLHESAAWTGVDIFTPSNGSDSNFSDFIFYHNGKVIDSGTGRSLILGTQVGAYASDHRKIIDNDSHFDVRQEFGQCSPEHIVATVNTRPNNDKINNQITTDVSNELSVHSFFLGWGSNISLGTFASQGAEPIQGAPYTLNSIGTMFTLGDFISYESQGGYIGVPERSVELGQGGIFVDNYGLFEVANTARTKINSMIATTYNGMLDFDEHQVMIGDRVGLAHAALDLSDPSQRVVVSQGSKLSDYSVNWKYLTRDPGFVPYVHTFVPAACQVLAATTSNIDTLPTIQGEVKQFQIQGSRLGDPAHIKVDGGKVRELLFMNEEATGISPVGVLVLTNDAEVGLGTFQRNLDSTLAEIVLGINGVTVIPDSSSELILNEDIVINGVCHLVTGPNFGSSGADTLLITSQVPREIRVKRGSVLDLSLFDDPNKILKIGGKVTLVFEPGSRWIFGGGTVVFTDDASIRFEPFVDTSLPKGAFVCDTDPFRVKISGTGKLIMQEDSFIDLPRSAFVGIESGGKESVSDFIGQDQSTKVKMDCSCFTDLTWIFRDAAKLRIGSDSDYGGVLQVGNTSYLSECQASVSFAIEIDGIESMVDINSQGFFGVGVGIVDKSETAPNNWLIDPLCNVERFSLHVNEGTFRHNQIFTGSDENAALWAVNDLVEGYNMSFSPAKGRILGGGNIVQINRGCYINDLRSTLHSIKRTPDEPISPIVETTDGWTTCELRVGILASAPTLLDPSNAVPVFLTSATQFFDYVKADPFAVQYTKTAQIYEDSLEIITIGYVNGSTIVRDGITGVRSPSGSFKDPETSLEMGACGIGLSENGDSTAYAIGT